MDRRTLMVSGAAAALVAAGGTWYATTRQPGTTTIATVTTDNADGVDTSGIMEMTLGSDDAPITLTEYASFTCPHCANFHRAVFKDLRKDYIDTGKVKFIYRDVYFDPFGLWASVVARCGGEERFFGIADMIYDQQSEWIGANTVVERPDSLR